MAEEGKARRRGSRGVGRATSAVYSVRIPKDLADEWGEYVERHGEEAAEAMRTLMRHLVKKGQPAHVGSRGAFLNPSPRSSTGGVEVGKKKQLKLSLTPSELAALYEVAEERECSIQFWIVSLIRAVLTDGTALGGAELKALGESLYQVTAIGRNLNQVVHAINADPGRHLQRVSDRSIERLQKTIDELRRSVRAVIEANTHRWELK